MNVAIVHDDLIQLGGAERLILAIHSIWPNAPVYTSFYDQKIKDRLFSEIEIKSSWMQKLPFKRRLRRFYLPFYPLAFESLNFDDYDLVISSSTRFAHSIITKPRTFHICYLNSPPRFLWDQGNYLKNERLIFPFNLIVSILNSYLRIWDQTAATRVDAYIANSQNIKNKIEKIYRRNARVIYPFVDLDKFVPKFGAKNNYFLIVTRLLSWKRVDLAIKACNQLKLNLKIIGTGPDFFRLKKLAGETIEFVGKIPDRKLIEYYQNCKALIVTQNEDFGIASLEAQACGKPVIAYGEGGILETVIEGKTGVFFFPQQVEALIDILTKFEKMKFDWQDCIKNAQKFSQKLFIKNFSDTVENLWHNRPVI